METKTETRKPGINRVRRQLLLGAGLAPVVVTLHAAKVFAEGDLKAASLSGAATYSAAVAVSGVGERTSGDTIEQELYEAVYNNNNANQMELDEQQYYGQAGSSTNGDTVTYNGTALQLLTWTYGTNAGVINWTKPYEERIAVPTTTFETEVGKIVSALAAVLNYNALTTAEKETATKPDVAGLATSYNEARTAFELVYNSITIGTTTGVHKFCSDVKTGIFDQTTNLLTVFNTAVGIMG